MDLSEKFALVASGIIVRINTLEEGRPYSHSPTAFRHNTGSTYRSPCGLTLTAW